MEFCFDIHLLTFWKSLFYQELGMLEFFLLALRERTIIGKY